MPSGLENRLSPREVSQVKDILTTLRAVVAEYGDNYIYPKKRFEGRSCCFYVYNAKPDCLAAKVLHRLGVSIHILAQREQQDCTRFVADNIGYGSAALAVLRTAQVFQDTERTWGLALAEAEKYATDRFGVTL